MFISAHFAWFLVVVIGGAAVIGAVRLGQWGTAPSATLRVRLITFFGAAIPLAILGALWRIHAVARVDGEGVAKLVPDRGADLSVLFTYITTMGDLVPSFVIATVLALLLFQRSGRWIAVLLPLDIFAQVVFQQAWLDSVKDVELTQVVHGITLGGIGGIPSGSMARLLSIFLIAAVLWRDESRRVAAILIDVGVVLIFVELVTRLYLARHLFADIAGGLLLGVMLAVVFSWLAQLLERRGQSRTSV